jgi:hypothetical protein
MSNITAFIGHGSIEASTFTSVPGAAVNITAFIGTAFLPPDFRGADARSGYGEFPLPAALASPVESE